MTLSENHMPAPDAGGAPAVAPCQVDHVEAFAGVVTRPGDSRPAAISVRALPWVQREVRTAAVTLIFFARRWAAEHVQVPGVSNIGLTGRPRGLPAASRPGGADPVVNDVLPALDGSFRLVALEGESRTVIATDLIASTTVCYAEQNAAVYFASYLGLLLQLLPRMPPLDQQGVACLLACRGNWAPRTLYEGVRRLGAAQYLDIVVERDKPRVDTRSYADPVSVYFGAPVGGSPDSRLRQLTDLMAGAVVASPPGENGALFLSSGQDSLAIALAARAAGIPFRHAVTFGDSLSNDTRGHRERAVELGLATQLVRTDGIDFWRYQRDMLEIGGGQLGLHVGRFYHATVTAAARFDRMTIGFLGNTLTGDKLATDGSSVSLETVERRLFDVAHEAPPWLEELYRDELRAVKAEIAPLYRALADLPPHQRYAWLDLSLRQGAYTATVFDAVDARMEAAFPLFERQLMKFWLNLDLADLCGRALYNRWIALQRERPRVDGRPARALTARIGRAIWNARSRVSEPVWTYDYVRMANASIAGMASIPDASDPRLNAFIETTLSGVRPAPFVPGDALGGKLRLRTRLRKLGHAHGVIRDWEQQRPADLMGVLLGTALAVRAAVCIRGGP